MSRGLDVRPDRRARRWPVRFLTFAATLLSGFLAPVLPRGPSDPVMLAIIALAGVLIGGDTIRPSSAVRRPADPEDRPTDGGG